MIRGWFFVFRFRPDVAGKQVTAVCVSRANDLVQDADEQLIDQMRGTRRRLDVCQFHLGRQIFRLS